MLNTANDEFEMLKETSYNIDVKIMVKWLNLHFLIA